MRLSPGIRVHCLSVWLLCMRQRDCLLTRQFKYKSTLLKMDCTFRSLHLESTLRSIRNPFICSVPEARRTQRSRCQRHHVRREKGTCSQNLLVSLSLVYALFVLDKMETLQDSTWRRFPLPFGGGHPRSGCSLPIHSLGLYILHLESMNIIDNRCRWLLQDRPR